MNHIRLYLFIFSSSIVFFGFSTKEKLVCDTANAGSDQVVCADTAFLSGNIPQSGSGTWTLFSGGATILNPVSPTSAVFNLSSGQNVFVWTISGGGCPTDADTVIFQVLPAPTISNAGQDQFLCNDSVATLSANIPIVGSGEWALVSGSGIITNPFSPNTTVTNLGATINVFEWKISSGSCASTDVVQIYRYLPAVVSVAGPNQLVCDTTFFLSANMPAYGQGNWSVVSGSANIFYDNMAGTQVDSVNFGDTLNFVWTITSGICPASTDTQQVIVLIPPHPNAGNDQIVCSPLAAINATNLSGQGQWTLFSGAATITSPSSNSTSVTALGPGENKFVWSVINGVCPADGDTVSVFNYENSAANAGPDQDLCSLSSVFAADVPVIGTGAWTLISGAGSVLFSNSPSSIVSNLSLGQNIFSWTISNGTCPSKTDTVVITVYASSTISFAGQDFTVCGNIATLSGSSPVNGIGTWSVVSGSGAFNLINSGNTTVTGLAPGSNALAWTIINGACPASSDTVLVTSVPEPLGALVSADTSVCSDSVVLFAATPLSGVGMWSVLSTGAVLSSATDTIITATSLEFGQNIFLWSVSSGICPAVDDTVIVTRDEEPSAAVAGPDINTTQGTFALQANTPQIGNGTWENTSAQGNIVNPNLSNSTFITNQSLDILLIWTITNGVCPAAKDTIRVQVELVPIPEIITPNGDGQNDYFLIRALQFSGKVGLNVYNRWGQLVYQNDEYKNDFEGKNNQGIDLPDDSYFYEAFSNGVIEFKGFLTIKRK